LDSEQIYIKKVKKRNYRARKLDEALTFAYGVDARTCDFADIAEADSFTQQAYFLGILLTHCLV
jgi:hypothetical protein